MRLFRILMALVLLALAAQLSGVPAFAADAGVCSWDSVRSIGALLRAQREAQGKALPAGAARPSGLGSAVVTKPKLLDEKVDKALARFERPVAEAAVPPKTPARLKASEAYQLLQKELGELRAAAAPRPSALGRNLAGEPRARAVPAKGEVTEDTRLLPAARGSYGDAQVTRGTPVEKLREGDSAAVVPARLIASQPDVGKALLGHYIGQYIGDPALASVAKRFRVADPTSPVHRRAYFESVAESLRQMGARARPGFIGPDLSNPGRRVLMIEEATHRSVQSHILTSAAEWKNLPPSMRTWLSPGDLEELGKRADIQLKVDVKKIYDTADEMAFDFARSGRGLLPEALETGTSFEARAFREAREAARRARNVGELAKVEREALVNGYRLVAREIASIGDDPLRSAVGRLFDSYKGLSDNGKNYVEFDVGRALNEPQLRERIRALEVTNHNFDSVPVQEALAHYLFDDPRVMRDFLRPLARPGKEKEFNGILDQIVSRRIAEGAAEKAGARIAAAEAEASRAMAYHERETRRLEQGLQKLRALEAAGRAPEGSLQRKMLTAESRQLEKAMAEVNRARDSLASAASFRNVSDPSALARGPKSEVVIKDVDRLPANVKVTQAGYGKAQVLSTLEWQAGKAVKAARTKAEVLHVFEDAMFTLAGRELPAVRGPPLKGGGRPVVYITDGHHSAMQLYMLAHGRFNALPPGVQKIFRNANVSFDEWQRLNRHRLLLNPKIERTYLSADELVADWVRSGRGLLSEDVEKSLTGELARARQALRLEPEEVAGLGADDLRRLELEKIRAVDPEDMRRLVDAYSSLPDGFRAIKDDPVLSTVGEAFRALGLGSDMVDYSQFRVYRDSPAFHSRLNGLIEDANRKHKGVNNLLMRPESDPERLAFLSAVNRALLDPDSDTPAVLARMAKPSHEAQAANLARLLKAQKEYHPQLRESGKLASASAPTGRSPASARPSQLGDAVTGPGMAPPVSSFQHARARVPGLPGLADLGPDRRVSEVVAEQARLLTRRREHAYRRMLKADPRDAEIRTFDTIIVGGGPQGVTAAANLKGTRTLLLNAGDRAGTFSDFGDTFVVNSNETFGQASTNIIHGGPENAQVRNLASVTPDAGDVYVTGRTIGDVTDLQLALTDAEVLTSTRAAEPVWDKNLKLWKVETPEGPFYAKNVARGTGLGEEKFTFAPTDKASWQIVEAEKKAGTHRVEFINHFMKRMQLASEEGVNPLEKLPGRSYVVVGGGDGGAIVAKYLTGLGPPEGYGGRALQPGEGQKKVFWFGQKSADRAAYEKSTWGPYLDLGPKFDDGGVKPVNAHMKRVERTTGPEAREGAFRFYYGDGPKDYVVADGMISAAGYDNSATRSFWSKIAGKDSKVETFMIEGRTNQGFIAKGVKVDGVEQKGLYEFGPATGGLETKGLPGGDRSPRIETLGPRTQELALRIRDELLADPTSKRTCLTCGLRPEVSVQPLARTSTYEAETTMKVKGRGFRVRDEGQREMLIRTHLADTVESLGLPAGRSVDLSLVPDPVRGELAIRSRSLERDDLGRLQAALKRNNLAELLLSQPSSKINKALSVSLEASDSGAVTVSKADFVPIRRDPVVRLADDEVAIIGYGSLINRESMEKTLGRPLGEGKIFDIEVDGYRRTKTVRMKNESFYEELPNGARHYPEYIAYYNVEPAKGERMTATMFVIKRSELDGFHQREWIYNPTDVGDRVLGARITKNGLEPKTGEAYIYVGKQEHMFDPKNPGDTRFRSTYDDIVNGAVAKKDPEYQRAFRETTSDDSAPVIADKKDATRRPMSDPVVPGSGAFVKYAMDEKTFVKMQQKLGYGLFPLKGKANLGGSLFRGMSVNPEQLERILSRGLELEKSMGGKFISTSKDASWAKLFQGRIGETSAERYVRVLFEVDPKSPVARKAGPDALMGKSDIAFTGDIPPGDIKAIYLLDPSKSVNPWTRYTVEQARKLRWETDLAKAKATGDINILGRASDLGNALTDAEITRKLGRDPFGPPELFRTGRSLGHSLDEKGRIMAHLEPQGNGVFRLSATNHLKADAGLDGRVPPGITDGLSVKVRGRAYGLDSAIPLKKGDSVDLELHGSLLGKYSFDGESFGRMAYASRVVNVFDLSRFANEPGFAANVRAGKEKWSSFRPEAKTSSFSELHSHLSGAIEGDALMGIALRRNTTYPVKMLREIFGEAEAERLLKNWKVVGDEVELRSLSRQELNRIIAKIQVSPEEITSFGKQLHAIYDYRWPLSRDPEAIAEILHQTARELKASGVKFTQLSHGGGNFTPQYLAMLERELPKIERETGVKIQVFYGIVRRLPTEKIHQQLDAFRNLKSRHVVGIDFLGEETESFQRLKDAGIGEKIARIRKENPGVQIKFHAGEAPEFPENVRLAVEMGANRIGHGTFGFVNGAAGETVQAIRQAASETPPRRVFVETQRGSNITLDYVRQGDIVREMDAVLRREGIPHGAYTDGHGIYGATPRGEFAITATSGGNVYDLAKIRAYERKVFADSLEFEANHVRAALSEARAAPSPNPARVRALETELESLTVRRDAYNLHALMGEARPASKADAKAYEAWFLESSSRLNRALDGLSLDDMDSLAAARREIDEAGRRIAERVPAAGRIASIPADARTSAIVAGREARIAELTAKLEAANKELRAAEAAWAAYSGQPRPRLFSASYDKARARYEAAVAARGTQELNQELPSLVALSRKELPTALLADPARFSNPAYYDELAKNPAAARRLLQGEGYSEEILSKWDEVAAYAGKEYSVLAADPALASRGDEFLAFATRYLKENDGRAVPPFELRQAFSRETLPAPVRRLRRIEELSAVPEGRLTGPQRDELSQLRRDHQADLAAIWPKTIDEAFPQGRASDLGSSLTKDAREARITELRAKIRALETEYKDAKALWESEQKKGAGWFYKRQSHADAQARFEAAEKAYTGATEFSELARLVSEARPTTYSRAYAEAESVKTLPSAPRQAKQLEILSPEQFDEKLAAMFPGRDPAEIQRTFREAGLSNPHGSLSGAIEQHTSMGAEARWQPIDMIRSQDPAKQKAGRLIQEIYDLHDNGNAAAREYFHELGRRHASRLDENRALGDGLARNQLPPPPAGVPGRYVDLATGIHTHSNFKFLDKSVTYQFNDLSPFVTGMNSGLAERFGLRAVSEQGNVMDMKAPAEKWAALRSKNMIGYEPRFAEKLPEMTEWIQPGGKLILQSDPGGNGFSRMATAHGPLVRRLMEQGWEASWDFKGKYYFDTIELRKPQGTVAGVDQARVAATWEKIVSREGDMPGTLIAAKDSRASALGSTISGRSPASAAPLSPSEQRLAKVRELAAKKGRTPAENDELAFLRGEVAAEENAIWPRSLADVHGRAASVEQQDTKLRALGADLAAARDPGLAATLTRQARELSHNLDAATDAARRRFEKVLASGDPVGTLEAELALREAQQARRVAKLATDLDANEEPLVRAYKQALVREADVKDPAARSAATRSIHDLEARIDTQAGRLRDAIRELQARTSLAHDSREINLLGRELESSRARLARLESARSVYARPQVLLGSPGSARASNLGAALFQHDLKQPPFGRVVTEASRAEYYKSLPKVLVGDSAKPWKDTDDLVAIGEKIRARARLGKLDPAATHIPELAAFVEDVLKGTRGAIEAQETQKLSLTDRLKSFFGRGVETREERLALMKKFDEEARARVASKKVTYEWWHDFNHRTEFLKTEAHNRSAVRGGFTDRFEKELLDSGGWKTAGGYRATAKKVAERDRFGLSEEDLSAHFPTRILMPTRSGDINVVPMNEMFGTNINPLGQIDRKVIADGRVMYPDHFRGHDFVHASNEDFVLGDRLNRVAEFRRQYLAYRELLPIERRATFEIAYFIGTHEIPQIADSLIISGNAADVWPRINNLEELVRSDQWLGNLVPASARTGEGTKAFIAEMQREMDEFGAAISPAMKEVLAREDAVGRAERALADAVRREKGLRDPITGKATPLATEERGAVNYLREVAAKARSDEEYLRENLEIASGAFVALMQERVRASTAKLREAVAVFETKNFAHAGIRVEGDLQGSFRLKELGPDGKGWVDMKPSGSPIASRKVVAGQPVAADALTETKLAAAVAEVKKAEAQRSRVLAMAAEQDAAEKARWVAIADGTPPPSSARASGIGEAIATYNANYAKLEPSSKRVVDFASALRRREEEFAARELAAGSNKNSRELAREFARRGHVPEIAAQIDGMLADAKAAIDRNRPGFLSKVRGRLFGGTYEDRVKLLEQFRAEANQRRAGGATYEWWQRFNQRLDILKTPLAERSPELANRRSEFLARLLETDAWKTEAGYNSAARAFSDGSVSARNAARIYPEVVLVPSRDGEVGVRALNELTGTNVHLVGKIGATEYVDGFHMNPIGFSDHDIVHASNYKMLTGDTAGYVTQKHFDTVRDEYFRYRDTLKGAARERFELAYHLAGHENPAALARLTETSLTRDALIRQFEGGQVARRLMDSGDLGKEYPEVRKAGPAAVARFEKEMMNDLLAFQERLRPRLIPLNAEYAATRVDDLARQLDVVDGLATELERVRKGGVEKEILQARRELSNYRSDVEAMFGMPIADLQKVRAAGPPPAYVAQIPTEPVVGRAPASQRASGLSAGLLAGSLRGVPSATTRRLAPTVARARESLELARMEPLAKARAGYIAQPSNATWEAYRREWAAYSARVSSPDLAHRIAPALGSASHDARVQGALRQELEHLAIRSRVAEQNLKNAVKAAEKARYSGELAVLLGEKARASALLAPEVSAGTKGANPLARFEELRRNAYRIHASEFGGLSYEQARRHPQLAPALNSLATKAAGEAGLATEARAEVARAARGLFGEKAGQRLGQLAGFQRQGKAATPDQLRAAARAEGWSAREIEGCVKAGLCASNQEIAARRAAAAEASRADAPVSRELVASKASGERPLAGVPPAKAADIEKELAASRKAVDAEAAAVRARLAKEGPSEEANEALRAVRAAQESIQEHQARLAREAEQVDSLLKRQRELGAGDSFVNAATGEITPTGRFAAANPKELEAAMKPAGDPKRAASRVMEFMKQNPEAIERRLLAAGASQETAKAVKGLSLDGVSGNPATRYGGFVETVSRAGAPEAAKVLEAVAGKRAAFSADDLAKVADELKPTQGQRLAAQPGDLAAQRALLEKKGWKADDIELCKAAGACLHERTPAEAVASARAEASETIAKAVEPEAKGRGLASAADPVAARIEGFKHADPDVYGLLKEAREQSLKTNKPMEQSLESALKRQLKKTKLSAEERQGLKDLLACLNP